MIVFHGIVSLSSLPHQESGTPFPSLYFQTLLMLQCLSGGSVSIYVVKVDHVFIFYFYFILFYFFYGGQHPRRAVALPLALDANGRYTENFLVSLPLQLNRRTLRSPISSIRETATGKLGNFARMNNYVILPIVLASNAVATSDLQRLPNYTPR